MPIHGCQRSDEAAMDDTLVPFRARMLDKLERQYLDIDAQGLAYTYMATGNVPADVLVDGLGSGDALRLRPSDLRTVAARR